MSSREIRLLLAIAHRQALDNYLIMLRLKRLLPYVKNREETSSNLV